MDALLIFAAIIGIILLHLPLLTLIEWRFRK